MSENAAGCPAHPPHIMIDIETLGTVPGSVIVSIGAVAFCPWLAPTAPGFILAKHQSKIDIADAAKAGLTIDADTVKWWLKQSSEAVASTFHKPTIGLSSALLNLTAFVTSFGATPIWAHSPSFDLVLIEAAYRATDLKVPWKYTQGRDTRTLFKLAGIGLDDFPSSGVAHDALSDAIHQAEVVSYALQALEITP